MRSSIIAALLLLTTCEDARQPSAPGIPDAHDRMEENLRAMRMEERDIGNYIERHALALKKSGTGVRWALVRDVPGDTVRPEDLVRVNYRVELIDGSEAYASEPGKPEAFRVEHDDVESGLHEAIQHLGPGDSAIIVIPSYRAHGLVGDQQRIPMRSTVIYRIGLVNFERK